MNRLLASWCACCGVAAFVLVVAMPAFAGPGTHGPDAEHLDAAGNVTAGVAKPRIETKSELFELVGYLSAGELSVMINRFETNEPVLDARVEVAKGALKAAAKFHSDHGDYAVDDPAFLKALSAPGEHALIFTVIARADSDLLEGSLAVTPAQVEVASHGHNHALQYTAVAAGVLLFLLLVTALWRRRRNRMRYVPTGELS